MFVSPCILGASLTGLVPAPKCMVYTNLACDGNMMTFPYLKQKQELSGFYIDVPYEKNEDSIQYVAGQLRELKKYLEDMTGKRLQSLRCSRPLPTANRPRSITAGSLH